jgi:HSP20 family protein
MATTKNNGGQQGEQRQPGQQSGAQQSGQGQRGELVSRQSRSQLMRDPFGAVMRDPLRVMRDLVMDPFRFLQIPAFRELGAGEMAWNPGFEVRETDDAFIFKADMPGIRPEDVDITLDGNELRISGKREQETEQDEGRIHMYERAYGAFSRSFLLPDTADLDKVRSDLKEGVLTLVVPKKASASQQRRKVQVGSGTKS